MSGISTHKTSNIITQRMISTQNTKVKALEYLIQKGKNNYWMILFVEVEKVIQITKSFAEFSWKKLAFGVLPSP